jgi:hypothetical protein
MLMSLIGHHCSPAGSRSDRDGGASEPAEQLTEA